MNLTEFILLICTTWKAKNISSPEIDNEEILLQIFKNEKKKESFQIF